VTPGDDTRVAILKPVERAGERAGKRCVTVGRCYDRRWIRDGYLRILEIILAKLQAGFGATSGLFCLPPSLEILLMVPTYIIYHITYEEGIVSLVTATHCPIPQRPRFDPFPKQVNRQTG